MMFQPDRHSGATVTQPTTAIKSRMMLDGGLLALLAAAGIAAALAAHGTGRELLATFAFLLVPGGAVVSRMRSESLLIGTALAITISLAVTTTGATAMAWTGWWYPDQMLVAVGAIAFGLLAFDLLQLIGEHMRSPSDESNRDESTTGVLQDLESSIIALIPLAVGLALWAFAISKISIYELSDNGLPPKFPAAGYAALLVMVVGAANSIWSGTPRKFVITAYVGSIALCLFGTIPLLAEVPQYAWTYKHIGVANLIDAVGGTSPQVDIYNRWPGFFAVSAVFAHLSGGDILSWAAWAEPGFLICNVILVGAVALAISRNVQISACAALVFIPTMWLGQTYFGAQALAYTLDIGVLLLVFLCFSGNWHLIRPVRWVATKITSRQPELAQQPPIIRLGRTGAILTIVILEIAIIGTHQLTPYILVIQLSMLWAVGMLRPVWLVAITLALTVAYLLPNLAWVNEHYGLLNSVNPADNVRVQPAANKDRTWIYGHAGPLNAMIMLLAGMFAAFALVRSGFARRSVPFMALVVAPAFVLLGNSYGGEVVLRVYMFGAPMLAVLVASAAALLPTRVRVPATAGLTIAAMTFFFLAMFGDAGQHVIRPTEVQASRYFYKNAPPGSVLMLSDPNFPVRLDARYAKMARSVSGNGPSLLDEEEFTENPLGPKDVPVAIDLIGDYSKSGFLVFSTTQFKDARIFRLTPPRSLENFESAVERSPRFELWYSNPDVRIYRLKGNGADG
ncbi:MAG: hypothetical protein WAO61_06905 [Solirubrobacterales bacterium]